MGSSIDSAASTRQTSDEATGLRPQNAPDFSRANIIKSLLGNTHTSKTAKITTPLMIGRVDGESPIDVRRFLDLKTTKALLGGGYTPVASAIRIEPYHLLNRE